MAMAGRVGWKLRRLLLGVGIVSGKFYRERGSASRPGALRADRTILQLHERTRDGKPETQSAKLMRHFRVSLLEGFENQRQYFGGNSNPIILNCDRAMGCRGVERADADCAAAGRKLDGVVEHVPDHLAKPNDIRRDAGVI